MRFLGKCIFGLLLLYCVFWASLAIYFSLVDRNKGFFESQLSDYFSKPVKIHELKTTWAGLSPQVRIKGFEVGDPESASPLKFESLTATLSPWSILRFWPQFSEFSVVEPVVEIASLNPNQLSIGGLVFSFDGPASSIHPKTVVRWLLDQHRTKWTDGTIVWRRPNGEQIKYADISFIFERELQNRSILAGFSGVNGAVNFQAQSHGDLLSEKHWGASLEIVDGEGNTFVAKDDLSLTVENGQGSLRLKHLQIQTIQDVIALSGLAKEASWLTQANVLGHLHDMAFTFSGSLFSINDWGLEAQASGVGFESKKQGPKINNLAGQVSASKSGGDFLFSTKGSVFEWLDKFETSFDINEASGKFSWNVMHDGDLELSLQEAAFDDGVVQLSNFNVETLVKANSQNINSLGDLFKTDSISQLDYKNQKLVSSAKQDTAPLKIDVSGEFTMARATEFHRYLPKLRNFNLLRQWWKRSFFNGELDNGQLSYQGVLSNQALSNGEALFNLSADFSGIGIDYGLPQKWPPIERGNGKLKIVNDLLTIVSNDAYIGGDKIRDFDLRIPELFKKNLELNIKGKVTKSLSYMVDFIFKGPLIAKKNHPSELPIRAQQGLFDLDLSVNIPLTNVNKTRVKGSAKVSNALAYLPGNVPISLNSGVIDFTEKSVSAKNLKGNFLGGAVSADIVTTKQAQPPVFKINAKGDLALKHLKPWVGEHLLSLMEGNANWQGALLIDGNNLQLNADSNLKGIVVNAPAPLGKVKQESRNLSLGMNLGSQPSLTMNYSDVMNVMMRAEKKNGSLFEKALIRVGNDGQLFKPLNSNLLSDGVHIEISRDDINLDQCISTIIQLADYESVESAIEKRSSATENPLFLDAMRSISISALNPIIIGRQFGEVELSLLSSDGASWAGEVTGENVSGSLNIAPFENNYVFDFSHLTLTDPLPETGKLPPIDYELSSGNYPTTSISIDEFTIGSKKLGQLEMLGASQGDAWELTKFELQRNGVKTLANGRWLNSHKLGSLTSFDFETIIEQADTVLDDFSLDGFIKKGSGSIKGNVNWIGAPHEFDFSRLNGDFDISLVDGELIKVEPGGGKLLGLLNFNAVARRLTLDFRDVFADGLTFDRMQYAGLFSDGKALMRDAYIFTPAVFVRMEGQIDIDKETIDMEIHMSPELGGNLALLSALANPAAGAVVFLTQRVFKNQIRDVNFTSFRALGSWEDFELEPFAASEVKSTNAQSASKSDASAEDTKNVDKQP